MHKTAATKGKKLLAQTAMCEHRIKSIRTSNGFQVSFNSELAGRVNPGYNEVTLFELFHVPTAV